MNKVSAAIVRVLNKHGATTGTGFVVSDDGLVVTCAHVVEYAGAGPGETMRLIFLESGVERQARVEPAFWRDASTQDIAILRLEGPSLEPLHPVALGKAAGTNDHQVGTFGFPDVKPVDGMPGKGEVIGTTTENGSQVLMIRSPEITPGFSGAPLLDLLTGRVIGMVSSIAPPDQYLRQGTTAFATPTETLRQVCTVLELSETCPYRGLHAFTEDDAAVFFGRKAFVKKLTEKLKQEPSFLAVLGPSGSGKSSLVQAGLVPLLRQGKLQGSDHWGVVIIRPTHDPFEQLSRQGLASPSHDLRMAVQQWFQQNPQQESLVLIIDQFEELFTSCLPSLSQLFVDQLTQLLDSPEAVTIILTMRDEFYSQFAQQAAKLVRWLERGTANVPSTLTQDELIEIVQAPAVSVGLNFETGLIETIVKDATDVVLNAEGERGGRSTILPLLEFALTQLWQERRANKELAVSESQRLAFASRSVSTSAPETALLLACEAVRWDHNPLSEDVLRDALDNTPWQVTAFTGHENWITSAIFSHDGQYILTASADGTARLWDLHGTCLARYQGHKKEVTSAIFSPDEKRILTTSQDGTAHLWHPDGRSIMTLDYPSRNKSGQYGRVKGTFSPDGRYMLICDGDEAWLWDADGNLQPMTWDTRPLMDTYYNSLAQGWHLYLDERARNEGHVERIYTAVFSPDGQRILTASSDETARVWDLAGQQLAILQGHTDQVINAVFSPDGQLILTGSLDKTARLWTSSGELLATLEGHMADVGHLAFSPDSQLMLTGVDGGPADDAVPRLWDRSGKLAATLIGHSVDARIMDIAFSPDGQRILTASKDKTARLWDLEGRPLAVLRGHLSDVWKATFSPNGQSILTASGDPEPRLWEPGGSPLALIEGHKGAITGAIYNEAGTHILTSSRDGTTRLWDIAGRCIAAYDGTAEPLTENVLSPDGRYLLTHENVVQGYVSVSGLVRQWQLPRTIRWFGQQAPRDGTQRVARRATHRRKRFSAGHGVSDAPLITFTVREETRSGSSGSVESAVFSQDGTRILIHASSNTQIRDRQGQLLAVLNGPNLNKRESLSVDYVMFSPDSQLVVTGSINGSVWLWTRDGQLITSFLTDDKSARDNLFSVTFSPDGQRILTTIRRSADLWDLNGHHLTSLPCSTNKVKRALFSPDGDRILTVAEAYFPNVSLWDRNGNFISQLHATYGEWAPICFDQQGKLLCIVDSNIAKIWDRDGSVVAVLVIDRETWITQITFSSDGEQLLLGTASGIAQLWSLRDGGKLLSTFKGHTSEVKSVVFSLDGRRVLTASSDGTARQFLVHADDLLAAASRRAGRSFDAQEIARFNIPTPLRFNPKV